jgi:hypothetical protein
MPRISFEELPDHGRLWVFPLGRALGAAEEARCLDVVDAFLAQWAAHGQPLRSAREMVHGRFVLVGVDVDAEAPSGCSIDALTNALRGLGAEMGASFIDHAPVWYRDGEDIRTVSRADFRALAAEGAVTPATHVFDTSLTRVNQLRAGALERPAAETWHGRAFFREQVEA